MNDREYKCEGCGDRFESAQLGMVMWEGSAARVCGRCARIIIRLPRARAAREAMRIPLLEADVAEVKQVMGKLLSPEIPKVRLRRW